MVMIRPVPSAGKMMVRYHRLTAPFSWSPVKISGNRAFARNSSGNRKTELKPMALWIAPHQTSTRIEPPTALDSTQARPQLRAFHHEMPKFSARIR